MNVFMMSTSGIKIRALSFTDWELVRAIYLDGIATSQATFETEAPSWEAWDKNHLPAPRLVAALDRSVVGWAALSPVSQRSVYAGVAETSVYVARYWHGQRVGRALLEALSAESENNGIWTLQASIFPENTASLNLHRSCGFRVVGTRQGIGKMNGNWRDTVLLERRSQLAGRD